MHRHATVFNRCKAKFRCFLDKGDAHSTGNMRKHLQACQGEDVLQATDQAKDANEVCKKLLAASCAMDQLWPHLNARAKERAKLVHWVSKSLCPFEIIKDKGFQLLMKTGQPEYYIPSPSTVTRDDDQGKFFKSKTYKITCTYQGYPGKVNFTTDGWTSPNHRAFVAVSVHLEHNGEPLTLPLDIIEITKVHSHLQHIYELFS
ncbi:hypothetical protein BD769DRAFT_1367803 [Suillus cothurnatus]|nr:hypothetical protein BD769DRAFT_1367803 [Suillus cothurnatus]